MSAKLLTLLSLDTAVQQGVLDVTGINAQDVLKDYLMME
jgi:hypothetical protein